MKRILLDIGFDYDFVLFGIVAQEQLHRLVWAINQATGKEFKREEDLILDFEEERMTVSRFSFHDELNHLDLELFSNRDEGNYWLPELRRIDYFLMVKGALESFRKKKFTEPFKLIPSVQIISEINHNKLKQKERLIF